MQRGAQPLAGGSGAGEGRHAKPGPVGGGEAVDSLSTGDRSEAIPLHSTRLLDRFRALKELKAADQEAVIRLLDAMILKNMVQRTLDLSEARTAAR